MALYCTPKVIEKQTGNYVICVILCLSTIPIYICIYMYESRAKIGWLSRTSFEYPLLLNIRIVVSNLVDSDLKMNFLIHNRILHLISILIYTVMNNPYFLYFRACMEIAYFVLFRWVLTFSSTWPLQQPLFSVIILRVGACARRSIWTNEGRRRHMAVPIRLCCVHYMQKRLYEWLYEQLQFIILKFMRWPNHVNQSISHMQ